MPRSKEAFPRRNDVSVLNYGNPFGAGVSCSNLAWRKQRCAGGTPVPAGGALEGASTPASGAATSRRVGTDAGGPPTPVPLVLPDARSDAREQHEAAAREKSAREEFRRLVREKGVHELDSKAKAGATRAQMSKVLAMLGGCLAQFPDSAKTHAGLLKKNLALIDMRAALTAKMHESEFADELVKARRVLDQRPALQWTPEADGGGAGEGSQRRRWCWVRRSPWRIIRGGLGRGLPTLTPSSAPSRRVASVWRVPLCQTFWHRPSGPPLSGSARSPTMTPCVARRRRFKTRSPREVPGL